MTAASAFQTLMGEGSGRRLLPPHPADQSATREDQAGKARADGSANDASIRC